jgi:biopolymer transport protein ExbB/TolQ
MIGRFLSYMLCILIWLGCIYQLLLLLIRAARGNIGETPLIGRLLNQPLLADRIAPIAITVILGWILVEVLLHFIRVAREWQAVQFFQTVVAGDADLRKVPKNSRAGCRANLFIQRSQSLSLHETVPGMAALDAAALDNAYSFIRVYIWVLPVIGFIGTAWGMSHAIAGFGESLKGNLDVATMTARLSQLVIPGLANAFSTTILALTAAIIGHFCASVLQSAEHSVLSDLDQGCVRLLASVPTEPKASADLSNLAIGVQEAVEAIGRLDLGPAADQLSNAATAMQNAATEMQRAATAPYHVTVRRGDE